MHENIEAALSRQINQELAAAHQYLAMALYFDEMDLPGFASWMRQQRNEELAHADRLIDYVIDRGAHVALAAVAAPKSTFESTVEIFEAALASERANTAGINAVYAVARDHDDFTTQSHLSWFLDEQVEEEKSMSELLSLVRLAKDDAGALLLLNGQLAERKFDPNAGAGA
jgi:ferritin